MLQLWQKRYSRENREAIGDVHDTCFLCNEAGWFQGDTHQVPIDEKRESLRNPNNDPRGRWRPVPMTAQAGHATPEQSTNKAPLGRSSSPMQVVAGAWLSHVRKATPGGGHILGKKGNSQTNVIRYVMKWKASCRDVVEHDEVGNTDESTKELLASSRERILSTPLRSRPIDSTSHQISTSPGDLILHSSRGSEPRSRRIEARRCDVVVAASFYRMDER